ncbi:MAG: tyrosine-type recombinase/integrase [Pirellula sp.]|jgi:integrase
MADSNRKSAAKRPRKTETLSFHKGRGYWYKTIGGRRKYFLSYSDDPTGQKSLEQWFACKDDPFGTPKSVQSEGCTLLDICNAFCAFKKERLDSGELSQRMFDEYHSVCELVLKVIDKQAIAENIDAAALGKVRAKLAQRYGVNGISKRIQQVRSMLKWAYESGYLDKPIRYGQSFSKPSAKAMRQHRLERGAMDFTADEIRRLLQVATPITRAMIFLGLQGGLGNSDIADLPLKAVDLKSGWLDYPRAKTATHRRIPLWPETIAALQVVIDARPETDSELFFISSRGQDFTDDSRTGWRVTGYFRQTLKKVGIQDGRGFHSLRRTFQTQAEESGDLVAVQAIMGHIPSERDMSARYRQRVSDNRLREAVEAVRQWLLPIEIADDEVAQ